MKQEKLSKSSRNFKAIGVGKVLAYLRADIQKARKSLFIVGPWIDGFFVREIIAVLHKNISVKFLVRLGEYVDENTRTTTLTSLKEVRSHVSNFEARSLPTLHAKAIIIDNDVGYIGSTNWYRYSLEQALEVTLRIHLSDVSDLKGILDEYWEEADPIPQEEFEITQRGHLPEINHEILDPLARKVLKENPKAFIEKIKKK